MTTPPPTKRPRVKCPRCGKRRAMQTVLKWRRTPEDEFAPVCGECGRDLFIARAYAEAVMTSGPARAGEGAPMTTPPPAGPTAERVCPICQGHGRIRRTAEAYEHPCWRCHGTGIAPPDEEGE